ncbi:MAG: hypothetical protein H6Q68_2195 [Firmicutes bacterium]|nr:hypothetical protein [Bacillota bacterium]
MKILYVGDKISLNGIEGIVLTAEITDDNNQWITADIEGNKLPMIVSDDKCLIPNNWSVTCESYNNARNIQWILAELIAS